MRTVRRSGKEARCVWGCEKTAPFIKIYDSGDIIRLIERYPDFKAMYQRIYRICQNVEDMMGLFSEELAKMDENTVKYMMDEPQEEINRKKAELVELESNLASRTFD